MTARPNVLIFCTDEQRADHLGCMGHPVLRTPNIDRIAAQGTLFRNCYSSCPVCMPARATMLTGLTNRASGVRTQGVSLPDDVPTLPGTLAKAGFRTHCVGKLHHRPWGGRTIEPNEDTSQNPERRIYWDWPGRWEGEHYTEFPENYYGYQTLDTVGGHVNYVYGDYVTWLETNHPGAYAGYDSSNADPHALSIDPELHYNKWIADRSIAFMEDHLQSKGPSQPDQPFYLWCSFPDPHEPFGAVKPWSDYYAHAPIDLPEHSVKLSDYNQSTTLQALDLGTEPYDPQWTRKCMRQTYGMVSHVDEQVGRVLEYLDQAGVADNTIVVFISDHGDQLGEHGLFYKGFYPYDGHARVPFVVKAPDSVQGKVVEDVVSMLDMVPTVLDLAGVEQPRDVNHERWAEHGVPLATTLPGEVLTPVVCGDEQPSRKNALIELDVDNTKVYDLLQYRSLVTNDYKLVYYAPTKETMLFDRRHDPDELRNLANDPACQGIVLDLFRQMVHELARTEARLPRFIGA